MIGCLYCCVRNNLLAHKLSLVWRYLTVALELGDVKRDACEVFLDVRLFQKSRSDYVARALTRRTQTQFLTQSNRNILGDVARCSDSAKLYSCRRVYVGARSIRVPPSLVVG